MIIYFFIENKNTNKLIQFPKAYNLKKFLSLRINSWEPGSQKSFRYHHHQKVWKIQWFNSRSNVKYEKAVFTICNKKKFLHISTNIFENYFIPRQFLIAYFFQKFPCALCIKISLNEYFILRDNDDCWKKFLNLHWKCIPRALINWVIDLFDLNSDFKAEKAQYEHCYYNHRKADKQSYCVNCVTVDQCLFKVKVI